MMTDMRMKLMTTQTTVTMKENDDVEDNDEIEEVYELDRDDVDLIKYDDKDKQEDTNIVYI